MGWFEDMMKGASDVAQSDVVQNYVAPALVNTGTNLLIGEINRQQADKTYQATKEQLESELGQFDKDYEMELSGKLTPAEQASRDALVNRTSVDLEKQYVEAKNNIIQRYTSAGIGGQRLADEIAKLDATKADKMAQVTADLDAAMLERAMNRQMSVKQARSGMLSQINQKLEPLAMASQPLDVGAIAAKSVAPGLVQGTVSAATGGDFGKSFKQSQYTSAVKGVGIDPNAFDPAAAERPFEVGGEMQEPTYSVNPITGKRVVTGYKSGGPTMEVSARTGEQERVKIQARTNLMNSIKQIQNSSATKDNKLASINNQISMYNTVSGESLPLMTEENLGKTGAFKRKDQVPYSGVSKVEVGTVQNGWQFMGGDPGVQSNWKKVSK